MTATLINYDTDLDLTQYDEAALIRFERALDRAERYADFCEDYGLSPLDTEAIALYNQYLEALAGL